jgi:hypothetical protein
MLKRGIRFESVQADCLSLSSFPARAYFASMAAGLVGCAGPTGLTVHVSAPSITTQPANQTVVAGQTATSTAVATGAAPLSYQWQENGANITSATSPSYTTAATVTSDSGSTFDVVVSNSAGTATSNAATLTVNAAVSTVDFSPTSLTFGNRAVSTSSSAQFLTFTAGQVLTNNDSETPSSFPVSADNVLRELVAAGKSWKAYAESLPSLGYLGGDTTSGGGQYYVRHAPIA